MKTILRKEIIPPNNQVNQMMIDNNNIIKTIKFIGSKLLIYIDFKK
jgi:hypothetical protein